MQQQRLQHIINSYSLAGEDVEPFLTKLNLLREDHPWFLIELALVEILVQNWLRYPLPRGLPFLEQVAARLQEWQATPKVPEFLTPNQFEQVTGLAPVGFDLLPTLPKAGPGNRGLVVEGGFGDRHYTTD